jgi:hypothetical protein
MVAGNHIPPFSPDKAVRVKDRLNGHPSSPGSADIAKKTIQAVRYTYTLFHFYLTISIAGSVKMISGLPL